MDSDRSETVDLLQQWHGGSQVALDALLARDLPWIEDRVRRRLGPRLRRKLETTDLVQETILEFLRHGPRVVVANKKQFRSLLARISENVIRGQHDGFTAQRRDWRREQALGRESVLRLDRSLENPDRPSQIVQREEGKALVLLGLEFLSEEDRQLIWAREFEGLSYREVGNRLAIAEDTARMRFPRALGRLASVVREIQAGRLDELLVDGEEG